MRRHLLFALHLSLALITAGVACSALFSQAGEVELQAHQPAASRFLLSSGRVGHFPFSVALDSATGVAPHYAYRLRFTQQAQPACCKEVAINRPAWHGGYQFSLRAAGTSRAVFEVRADTLGLVLTGAGVAVLVLSVLALWAWRLAWRSRRRALLPLLCAAAFALVYTWHRGSLALPPVLQTPWLAVHVSLCAAAYALFFALWVIALRAVCHRNAAVYACALRRVDALLPWGVGLLSLGIAVGGVWAQCAWGRFWGWDAKETCALATLLVYALPLHARYIRPLRSARVRLAYLACAFVAVLITYFGANYLFPGLHSYA